MFTSATKKSARALAATLLMTLPVAASPASQDKGTSAAAAEARQPPIAVSDHEVDGVEVALLSVKRISDGTLTVKWEYRNKANEAKRLGESFDGMGWSEPYSLVYHAYLVDARNRTKYPVLKDAKGNLLAGKHGPGKIVVLGPGRTVAAWAKFAAPPADVRKISVFIPGAQPFEDVPIAE